MERRRQSEVLPLLVTLVAAASALAAGAGCAPSDCIHNGGAATTTVVGGDVTLVLNGASETFGVAAAPGPALCAVVAGGRACDANAGMSYDLDVECTLASGATLQMGFSHISDLRASEPGEDMGTVFAHVHYSNPTGTSGPTGECSASLSDEDFNIVADTVLGGQGPRPELVTEDYLRELRIFYSRDERGFGSGECDFDLGIDFEIELRQDPGDFTTDYYCDCI